MKKKFVLWILCFVLVLPLASTVSVTAKGASSASAVSPGLFVIAADNSMAKAGLTGKEISFSRDDFARAVNLSKIDSVTVTRIPPTTDGELRVGDKVLKNGDTLNGRKLSSLVYVPSKINIRQSSFDFRVNGSPVDIRCNLYQLEKMNNCPTLMVAGENYLNVSTQKNITLFGTLPAYDPDGDKVRIEIVSYPEKGLLELTDTVLGEYKYIPDENFAGKDEFTYVARDIYGNYSASKTVSLTVERPKSSLAFADMAGSPAEGSALALAEEGIMSGTTVGGEVYFEPDRAVTRGEFVVMAMNAIGMRKVTSSSESVFADEEQMPEPMRKYVNAAYRLGFIKGEKDSEGNTCFYPDRKITRAEAACILASMIEADTPVITPVFSDAADIPAWAAPSLYSLSYMGIMPTQNGSISPTLTLTRADTAMILSRIL